MSLIRGSFLHGLRAYVFWLEVLTVKPIQCCSIVVPCMIELNVTPGYKSHLSLGKTSRFMLLNSIVRESYHCFSFAILSDTSGNFGLDKG